MTATFSGKSFRSVNIDEFDNEITAADSVDTSIHRWGNGVGIRNSGIDNSHAVDGRGWDDYVEISFDNEVSLESVDFTYFTEDSVETRCRWSWYTWTYHCEDVAVDGDDFRWMFDSNEDGSIGVGDFISASLSADPYSSFDDLKSNVFAIGAFDWNDDWKLKEISVSYHEVAAVPLPASSLLLLAGMGGLAAMRRRTK